MSDWNFMELLDERCKVTKVCLGIDPDETKLPEIVRKDSMEETLVRFTLPIIDLTHEHVATYKPNRCFFAPYGDQGARALQRIIGHIHEVGSLAILDFKGGDIGNSNIGLCKEAFDFYHADAVTVSPYLGYIDALDKFIESYPTKGVFVLCRTSSKGSNLFQNLTVRLSDDAQHDLFDGPARHGGHELGSEMRLYQNVGLRIANHWNTHGNCGMVYGATHPSEVPLIRPTFGELTVLFPGFGNQGGQPKDVVPYAKNSHGRGWVGNSSGALIHASQEDNYAEVTLAKTIAFKNDLNAY